MSRLYNIPNYSIFDISRLQSKKKFELYKNGILEFSQIENIDSFSVSQQIQIESELKNKTIINGKVVYESVEESYEFDYKK